MLALGDTAISHDPIGAQGAQGALIQAAQLVKAAREHDGAFDRDWLEGTFEHFWRTRGEAAVRVTRLFLGDPEFAAFGQLFFTAAAVSPAFGSALFGLLSDPSPLLGIESEQDARDFVTAKAGEPAADLLARYTPPARFSESTFTPGEAPFRRAS